MKNTNLIFTADNMRIEVTGANLLQAFGHLEAELCAHTGGQDCLSEHPALPDCLRALQDGEPYEWNDFSDPEGHFRIVASQVDGPHNHSSADVTSEPAPPHRCDTLHCEEVALWFISPKDAPPHRLCQVHGEQAERSGWKLLPIVRLQP